MGSRSRPAAGAPFAPNPQRCSPRARRPGPRPPGGRCRSPHARKRPYRARRRQIVVRVAPPHVVAIACAGAQVDLRVPNWGQASASTRSRRRPARRCSASGWLMLKVPCTAAIVIPLSAASRRIRPATSGEISSGISGNPAQSRLTWTQSSPQALTASSRSSRVPRPKVPSRMPIWMSGGCCVPESLGSAAASKLGQPGAANARAATGVALFRKPRLSRRMVC